MPKPRFRVGDTVGPWTLEDYLGGGGNGEVWEAARAKDQERKALKIPFQFSGEPYARFMREAKIQQECADIPGVLPILDVYLPESPSKRNRPWCAMPICTPADEALADAGLPEVVEAVIAFADTLARLHKRGVAHRDVKPGNLYYYEESWYVGDFGLVDVPDTESLTITGKPLGPRYYLPPELLSPAVVENFTPADVFMLAKTLWALATGQLFPPPGEQRADVVPYRLETWVSFAQTRALDGLIERGTRAVPGDRPSMAEVAQELRAWVEIASATIPEDSERSAVLEHLRRAISPRIERDDVVARLRVRYDELLGLSNELITPLERDLTEYGRPETGAYDTTTEKLVEVAKYLHGREIIERRSPALRLKGPGEKVLVFGLGRYLALTGDDELFVAGAIYIQLEYATTNLYHESRPVRMQSAPADSVLAEKHVRQMVRELSENANEWIEKFAAQVEGARHQS